MSLYPLKFNPVLKHYIWGGRNLNLKLNRPLPAGKTAAESWEIAGHPDGTTPIANGPLAGRLLTDLLDGYGVDLIGENSRWALERGKFPLLIKILDAAQPLSVQVHPDDAYALEHEGNELGKTEMWVVLHADPGAEVILGVTRGTNRSSFRQAIEDGRLEPFLHRLPVQAGDHINVPAGSLHAILGGLLIAEIQQNSNTTYRVYDWNRTGSDGRPRPLHVDKALEVINFDQVEPDLAPGQIVFEGDGQKREQLNETPYFTVERVTLAQGAAFEGACQGATFEIWGTLHGAATVEGDWEPVDLPAVSWCLLPAVLERFAIRAAVESVLLRAYVSS